MSGYQLGPADPADAEEVYAAAGFRPDLVDDLGLVISLGGSAFAARLDNRVVGLSSCLPFDSTGWIGGVAVLPEHGRRGLGERLTALAVSTVRDRGALTVLLHATAAARPLYKRMGFVDEADFVELVGPALETQKVSSPAVRAATMDDLDDVLALDRDATGEDRSSLLRALWPGGARVYDDSGVVGYHLPQIPTAVGAVVTSDPAAGLVLLSTALGERDQPTRVPFQSDHREIRDLLGRAGYTEHARTTRMRLGAPVDVRPERLVSAFNLYWG